MTSTAGGASIETAGTLTIGLTTPATYLLDLVPSGGDGTRTAAIWTMDEVSVPTVVTVDAAPSDDGVIFLRAFGLYPENPSWSYDAGRSSNIAVDNTPLSGGKGVMTFIARPFTTYYIAATTLIEYDPDTTPRAPLFDYYSLSSSSVPLTQFAGAGGTSWSGAVALTVGENPGDTYSAFMPMGDEQPYNAAWFKLASATEATIAVDCLASTGSPSEYDDTYVQVFSGSSYAGRVLVAENDDVGDVDGVYEPRSALTFSAEAGVTYRIAVGSYGPRENIPSTYSVNIDWGAATPMPPSAPSTTSVAFSDSGVTLYGDGETPYTLVDEGLVMPGKVARIRYAADSDFTHGSVALASQWQQSFLTLRVRVEGTSETDLAANLAELEEAIGQFAYTVTVNRDAQVTMWQADQGSMQLERSRRFYADEYAETWALTIPVHPISS